MWSCIIIWRWITISCISIVHFRATTKMETQLFKRSTNKKKIVDLNWNHKEYLNNPTASKKKN